MAVKLIQYIQTLIQITCRLKFFAKAIGETNPIYTDEAAALEAGYRALPAPPRRSPWC